MTMSFAPLPKAPRRCAGLALAAFLLASTGGAAMPTLAADAHVHGQANLEVSLSGSQMLVLLRGPAQVFFGFEHAPASADEAAVVREAMAALEQPVATLLATNRSCTVDSVRIDSPFSADLSSQDLASGEGREEPGADHHESRGHDEEAHSHHHADLEAEYSFSCSRRPASMTVTAFATFPELEHVEAAWIDEAGGGSARLSVDSPRFSLTRD